MSVLRTFERSGIEYSEVIGPWVLRSGEQVGFLAVALPRTFLVSASRVTRTQVFAFTAFGFFLILIVGALVANRITRPLLGVVRASEEIAKGNLDVAVEIQSNDELAILANSFNEMVESLQHSRQEILEAYDSTLEGWSLALELRDEETEGHSQRVTSMAVRLAEHLGVEGEELVYLRWGALLHDIGKMGIPDSILLKEGPLDDSEWEVMRRHPIYSHELLSRTSYLRPALDIPYAHHERWDGTGYPRGLKGEAIPFSARIFAVVDVWDAITSDRPYRKAMTWAQAEQVLEEGHGTHFDPEILVEFVKLLNEDESVPEAA